MRVLRQLLTLIFLAACLGAHAADATETGAFVQLLKDRAQEKVDGPDAQRRFYSRLTALADQGDRSAQFVLGLTLLKSRPAAAQQYLAASARAGCAGAETALGILEMTNAHFASGVAHFRQAAAAGDAAAQVALSGLHERGEHGVDKSVAKAHAWLRVAERQTYSSGALRAINDSKAQLAGRMRAEEIRQSDAEFGALSGPQPKAPYYFCGQFNLDVDLAPDVPDYYKIR